MTTTTDLIARLDALTNHAADCSDATYAPDDLHDIAMMLDRDIMTSYPERPYAAQFDLADYDAADDPDAAALLTQLIAIHHHFATNIDQPTIRDFISRRALDHSLCPLHFCDYAICFDDDDDECATIRALFPSHDT